jgi:ribosomal protein L11 methyltransferase
MGDWLEFSVKTDGEMAEAVSELFNRFGTGGAVIEQRFPERGERTDGEPHLTTKTFIPAADSQARRTLEEALHHLSIIRHLPEPQIRLLPEREWAESWKRDYHVQHIGECIVIVPSWVEYAPEGHEVVIRLDPGMAFGTGLHPSTRLCLQVIERLAHRGAAVLDVGTGSGILSIAAAKLGCSPVVALDTDPLAVQVAQENVELNGVAEQVRLVHGSIDAGAEGVRIHSEANYSQTTSELPVGAYDLVVANIIAEVIVGLSPALAASLAPAGHLIVSGIIADKQEAVLVSLSEAALRIEDQLQDGDWMALLATRS